MKSEQTVGDLALDFEFNFYVSLYKKLPNDKRLISILAELYTRHGEIEEGLELDRKLVEIDESNATAHYNLACSLSLVENFEEAICALRKSISLGYCDFNWMFEDQDLQAFRTTEYFTQLKRDLGFL
jgi:tetratricopeptide (TPR) repeat protein